MIKARCCKRCWWWKKRKKYDWGKCGFAEGVGHGMWVVNKDGSVDQSTGGLDTDPGFYCVMWKAR